VHAETADAATEGCNRTGWGNPAQREKVPGTVSTPLGSFNHVLISQCDPIQKSLGPVSLLVIQGGADLFPTGLLMKEALQREK
jgi:hypothetical protein